MVSPVDATGRGDIMLLDVLLIIFAIPIVALSVFGHLLLHLFAEYWRNRSQRNIAHPRHPLSLANQAA
jgi:hypothetical protein